MVVELTKVNPSLILIFIPKIASAHTGDQTIDEYPDISGITTARVSFFMSFLEQINSYK